MFQLWELQMFTTDFIKRTKLCVRNESKSTTLNEKSANFSVLFLSALND